MPLKQATAHRKDLGKMADLQHRHFATIATIIRELDYTPEGFLVRQMVADHFAHRLRRTNPKFDRARFLAACGAE